jgi:CheY-like chemotaxis protein
MTKNIEILVVDDEQGYRDLFVYMLEPLGMAVTCVSDGLEAVQKVGEQPYDLILMDVHMPKMSGPEALKKIKTMRREQKVIIFSSCSDPAYGLETEVEKNGDVEVLYKPVDAQEILQVIKKTLEPGNP